MKPISVRIMGESDSFGDYISNEWGSVGKGIHFVTNGWVLSAQSGWGNYWSGDPSRTNERLTARTLRSDCEIALWQEDNPGLIGLGDDSVLGWVPWGQVLQMVYWLANLTDIPSEDEVREYVLKITEEKSDDMA